MELTALTHALLAVSCMLATYMWGYHLAVKELSISVVDQVMNELEDNGIIKTKIDGDDKVLLVPTGWKE